MRKQDEDRNGKPEALLWLDFETTGTDRNDSLPLEVGMECTDVLGEHSYGSLHRIIRPDYLDLLDMSPIAFSMHADNGLLFELLNGSAHDDCVDAVANAVEEYLESLSQRFILVPAGTNVDFDIDFLKRLDMNPDRWLSYRKFDLTTLRRYLTFLDCPEDPYGTHSGTHVTLDGPLDLIRLSPVHAVLKYRGIGLHVIDCDLRHHTNKTSDGIRAVVITEGKP